MVNFGYPYNDIVICKDSTDYLEVGVFNAWREAPCSAWRSHAFARGVRGHAPPRKFLKIVQFGAF